MIMNNPRPVKLRQTPYSSRHPNDSQPSGSLHGIGIRLGTVSSRITYLQSLGQPSASSTSPYKRAPRASTEHDISKLRAWGGKRINCQVRTPTTSTHSNDSYQALELFEKHAYLSPAPIQSNHFPKKGIPSLHSLPSGVVLRNQSSPVSPKYPPRLDSGIPEHIFTDTSTPMTVNGTRSDHRNRDEYNHRPLTHTTSGEARTLDLKAITVELDNNWLQRVDNKICDGATSPVPSSQIPLNPTIRPSSARKTYTKSILQPRSNEISQPPTRELISREPPSEVLRLNPRKLKRALSGIENASYISTPPFSLSGALLDGGGGPRFARRARTEHDFVIRHHHHRRQHLAHHRSHYSSDECDGMSGCVSVHGFDFRSSLIDERISRSQSLDSNSQYRRQSYQSPIHSRPPSHHRHLRAAHHSRGHTTESSTSLFSSSSSSSINQSLDDALQAIECSGYPRTGHARHNSPMTNPGIVGVCQHCLHDCTCEACQSTHHNVRCCTHESHQPFVHHHTIGGRRVRRHGRSNRSNVSSSIPNTLRSEVGRLSYHYPDRQPRNSPQSPSGRQSRIDEWNKRQTTPSICIPSRNDYLSPSRRTSRRTSLCRGTLPEVINEVEAEDDCFREISDRCSTRPISRLQQNALVDIYAKDQRPKSANVTSRGIRPDYHSRRLRRRPVRDVVRFVERNGRLPRSHSGMSRSWCDSKLGEENTVDDCMLEADGTVKEHQLGDIVCLASVPGEVENRPFYGSRKYSRLGSRHNSYCSSVSIHNHPQYSPYVSRCGTPYGSRHSPCHDSRRLYNLSRSSTSASSSSSSSNYLSPILPTHCGSRHYSPRLRTPRGYPGRESYLDNSDNYSEHIHAGECRHSREYSCGQIRSQHTIKHRSPRESCGYESPFERRRRLNRSRRCSDLRDEVQNRRHRNSEHDCVWKRRFLKSNTPICGSGGMEDDLQAVTVILRFENREDVVINTDLKKGETADLDV